MLDDTRNTTAVTKRDNFLLPTRVLFSRDYFPPANTGPERAGSVVCEVDNTQKKIKNATIFYFIFGFRGPNMWHPLKNRDHYRESKNSVALPSSPHCRLTDPRLSWSTSAPSILPFFPPPFSQSGSPKEKTQFCSAWPINYMSLHNRLSKQKNTPLRACPVELCCLDPTSQKWAGSNAYFFGDRSLGTCTYTLSVRGSHIWQW